MGGSHRHEQIVTVDSDNSQTLFLRARSDFDVLDASRRWLSAILRTDAAELSYAR
jgi:hypothetical protein